jgi:hypothetical protein
VSADLPSILDDSSFDRETIVASLSNEQWSDDVVNITVHPAAVAAARLVKDDNAAAAVSSDDVLYSDLDSVMDELATADWWDTPLVDAEEAASLPTESVSPTVTSSAVSQDSQDQNDRWSASLLGLALASMTVRRRRKEK